MKYIINILSVSLFVILFTNVSYSQNWGNGVKGKGEIVTKDLDLDKFTGIKLGISGDVILTKGSTQKVRVEGQQNIIDLLKTSVSGNVWKIGFEQNVSNYKSFKIYITLPTLTEVGLSGSGDITCTNLFDNLGDLSVYVSGSGNMNLNASAKSINTKLSGSGNITLKGKSSYQEIKVSGSGNIEAFDLIVEEASVNISGSGNIQLNVAKELNARISGSGDIIYKGDPNVKANVSGSGDVRKKG